MENAAQLALELKAEMERSGYLSDTGGGLPYYEIDAAVLERVYEAIVEAVDPGPVIRIKLTPRQRFLLNGLYEDAESFLPRAPYTELLQNEIRSAKVLERYKYIEILSGPGDHHEARLTALGIEEAKRLRFRL